MKRFIALLLVIVTILLAVSSCGLEHFNFNDENDSSDKKNDFISNDSQYITRIEWAKMLGTYFGMDTCMNDEPYFVDVPVSNPSFAYLQSCVEWDVFSRDKGMFNPNDCATVEFVINSAVKASETLNNSEGDAFKFALSKGVVEGEASDFVTKEYAKTVVEWAVSLYQDKEFIEYENVEFVDGIIDLTEFACDEDGILKILNCENSLSVGDIIMTAPTWDNPGGVARKITSVLVDENGQTVVETTEPKIGEVYKELDFAQVGTIEDYSSIKTEEGVMVVGITPMSVQENNNTLNIVKLGHSGDKEVTIQKLANKGKDLIFSVNTSNGVKVTRSTKFEQVQSSFELKPGDDEKTKQEKEKEKDLFDKTGKTKEGKTVEKYDKGWELEGTLALKNFYVETEFRTKKIFFVPVGIELFEVEVHYELVNSLSFKGKIESEIKIASVPIPIGTTGVSLTLEIYATASANGDVTISTSVSNTSNVKYTSKNGLKKTQTSKSTESAELSVNFRLAAGARGVFKAVGMPIIDLSLEIGIGLDASAKLESVMIEGGGVYFYDEKIALERGLLSETTLCLTAELYPTITLSLGMKPETLAYKLGVKVKWKIMDKNGATLKSPIVTWHYELSKGIVHKCTLELYEYENDETAVDTFETEMTTDNDKSTSEVMNVSHYAVSLIPGEKFKLFTTSIPIGISASDVIWTSDDNSVVKVENVLVDGNISHCTIQAISPGVSTIVISTSDGEQQIRCAVMVHEKTSVEFNPLG